MSGDEIGIYLKNAKVGDFKSLAKLLTCLERHDLTNGLPKSLFSVPATAFRVGITGPPGAGKSTLIGRLIKELRQRGLTIAVLAIDPSSPFSRGAFLGDRIRFAESFNDPGVFIRSIGSRGSTGGLTASAYLLLRAFDAWKFDIVLVETVGVGQTELDVMYATDHVVVTLVPEAGDSIQAMKAGLLEIADLFVVNKADRPGSEAFAKELRESLLLADDHQDIKVLMTDAINNRGIGDLVDQIMEAKSKPTAFNRRRMTAKLHAEARAVLFQTVLQSFSREIESIKSEEELGVFVARTESVLKKLKLRGG